MDGKTNSSSQPGQAHSADNLDTQLAAIMVNIGRIVNARKAYPDRADTIIANSTKKIRQSTESFHMTLDDMENEITRAKAVFLRDLQVLRNKKQAAQQAAAPVQSQPPAPMIIDLDAPKPPQPSAPVAPMMAVGGASFPNRPAPKLENNPVAPFPDMGMGMGGPQPKPAVVPFGRVKPPVEQTRPSPKQPTPTPASKPAPKSNPPSGRLANKPSPMTNAQKQAPKPPATAPPSASAVAPAPAAVTAAAPPAAPPAAPAPVAAMSVPAAQPPPNVSSNPAPQSTFTNAMFTVDPTNSDVLMQPSGGQDLGLDMTMLDMDSFGNSGASGSGPAETANMDVHTNQNTNSSNNSKDNNDSTMTDLDHFFDMGGDSSTSFDDNFNNIDDYINNDFTFDTFQ